MMRYTLSAALLLGSLLLGVPAAPASAQSASPEFAARTLEQNQKAFVAPPARPAVAPVVAQSPAKDSPAAANQPAANQPAARRIALANEERSRAAR